MNKVRSKKIIIVQIVNLKHHITWMILKKKKKIKFYQVNINIFHVKKQIKEKDITDSIDYEKKIELSEFS